VCHLRDVSQKRDRFVLLPAVSDLAQIASLRSGTTDYIVVVTAIFGNILELDRVDVY
jgi:hypothetical protein